MIAAMCEEASPLLYSTNYGVSYDGLYMLLDTQWLSIPDYRLPVNFLPQ